jgi:hypothetical protein
MTASVPAQEHDDWTASSVTALPQLWALIAKRSGLTGVCRTLWARRVPSWDLEADDRRVSSWDLETLQGLGNYS